MSDQSEPKPLSLWITVDNEPDPSIGKTVLRPSPKVTPEEREAFINGTGPLRMEYVIEQE
jgi:hypothetical protein